jgi:hypothetical protein
MTVGGTSHPLRSCTAMPSAPLIGSVILSWRPMTNDRLAMLLYSPRDQQRDHRWLFDVFKVDSDRYKYCVKAYVRLAASRHVTSRGWDVHHGPTALVSKPPLRSVSDRIPPGRKVPKRHRSCLEVVGAVIVVVSTRDAQLPSPRLWQPGVDAHSARIDFVYALQPV